MKAMIFAAGLGTRLKPLTDSMPKALVEINGKPLLEHVLLKLISSGFDEIIINVHHFPEQIVSFLKSKNNFGVRIEISDESGGLLDTGGGIRKAQWFFDDGKPFLVHNVDILSNLDLSLFYHSHLENNCLGSLIVSSRDTFRYLLFNQDLILKGWINEKTAEIRPSDLLMPSSYRKLAFSGIQILHPQVFKLMDNHPDKFSVIDFYLQHLADNSFYGYIPGNYKMMDVGKLNSIEEAGNFIF